MFTSAYIFLATYALPMLIQAVCVHACMHGYIYLISLQIDHHFGSIC